MGIRRKAREMALKAAFEIDFSGSSCDAVIENIASNQKIENDVMAFMQELLEAYITHAADIDKIIEKHSNNWKLSRMASVDRNILRLGVMEILYKSDIPKNVTINEYLEIAKKYGTEDSSSFINGILDKINKKDGSIEFHDFTEEEGSIMLDPDVKMHFRDSESVNKVLREYIAHH